MKRANARNMLRTVLVHVRSISQYSYFTAAVSIIKGMVIFIIIGVLPNNSDDPG